MQIAMTVAATKIQIFQENNWSQAQEPPPVSEGKKPAKDEDPACSS